jgi:hypothetical protein
LEELEEIRSKEVGVVVVVVVVVGHSVCREILFSSS